MVLSGTCPPLSFEPWPHTREIHPDGKAGPDRTRASLRTMLVRTHGLSVGFDGCTTGQIGVWSWSRKSSRHYRWLCGGRALPGAMLLLWGAMLDQSFRLCKRETIQGVFFAIALNLRIASPAFLMWRYSVACSEGAGSTVARAGLRRGGTPAALVFSVRAPSGVVGKRELVGSRHDSERLGIVFLVFDQNHTEAMKAALQYFLQDPDADQTAQQAPADPAHQQ